MPRVAFPAALAHQRAPQQQRRHGGLIAVGAVLGAAALAERALFHDQRRLAARDYLLCKVAVAAGYRFLHTARILGADSIDMCAPVEWP